MFEEKITSDASEGIFNEFVEDQLDSLIENIVENNQLDNLAGSGSDIIFEMDQIESPRFIHDSSQGGGQGKGSGKAGKDAEKIRFSMPFAQFMSLVAKHLGLPDLKKEGAGRIREVSEEFKTFGPRGVILDKRRTFKRAFKTSVATGVYDPENGKHDIQIHRKDKRFKLPEEVEKDKYQAVVFYMGDVSYSTHGDRLALEKQLVHFIQNWLDFNYGPRCVEHRFFVHDYKAYEVTQGDFYNVSNAGGTYAAMVFELVSQIALSEYDPASTNLYGFYFGDGEIFRDDGQEILKIIEESMRPYFNRIGVVEVLPSGFSSLFNLTNEKYKKDRIIRAAGLKDKGQVLSVIKTLFG